MRRTTLLSLALGAALVWPEPGAQAAPTFPTGADFVAGCAATPSNEDCTGAVLHVEQVVNDRDNPNATCDGGIDGLLQARDSAELERRLTQRVVAVVAWLKLHPEYDRMSYGDAIWAGLKGAYCR
ncbi:MAG: hypothetical protein Q7U11_09220 [Phenylobacterium sp.]|uniref:hypothetical protein n=1 Tax=Phenylobacterium sp. TaxID=1871053 RepID=UPI00271B8C01|nr:hypothetical protein [Phenylobacterium sp.]MDO9246636.1 hypothetical protein [Phenylobacterium sp.]MDP3635276.1 hypothetical protein [Phenylobacterium sp.]HQT52156.1 hypothetical protein [Phenylobacterium sp.]